MSPTDCRANALTCERLAKEISNPEMALAMAEMAQQWTNVASHLERFSNVFDYGLEQLAGDLGQFDPNADFEKDKLL
jgi:hypothetical protein